MTLPNENLDSLLSGYLDDALTADERARVEQLLESDADVRSDLESMRDLQKMLRFIDQTDRRKAASLIGPSFSEKVIDAAIECARSEGVPEDHPLLRSTEAPSYRRAQSKRGKRLAVIVAALAASGLIGILVFAPDRNGAQPDQVAQHTSPTQSLGRFEPTVNEFSDGEPGVGEPGVVEPNTGEAMIALGSNNRIQEKVVAVSPTPKLPVQPTMANTGTVSDPNDSPEITNVALPTPVLVFDVRISDLGRIGDPIRAAMDVVGIAPASQKAASQAMVSSLTDAIRSLKSDVQPGSNTSPEDISGKVIYIEASAKKIDRLMNTLWADREGIESFGFNMTLETPLSNVVESLSTVRATQVQHSQTIEFSGELGAVASPLANYLGNRTFDQPKTERGAVSPNLDPTKDGREEDANDFMSRVFLIIR
jgi:anti-sigma factor RsiW